MYLSFARFISGGSKPYIKIDKNREQVDIHFHNGLYMSLNIGDAMALCNKIKKVIKEYKEN